MIRNYIIFIFLLFPTLLFAQKAKIAFDSKEHNFGRIQEKGGKVSFEFTFKNEGDSPLIIRHVEASCGCTVPKWDKRPIPPGGTGSITVTFNPRSRPGNLLKKIVVYTNATPPNHLLKITGKVVEEPIDIQKEYPFAIGSLRFTTDTIRLDAHHPKQIIGMFQNEKKKISLDRIQKPTYLELDYSPLIIQKQQKGDIIITLKNNMMRNFSPSDTLIITTSEGVQGKFIIKIEK
ncbi:DUF1573 domain-containing protein [Gabonibacter chumensis]|uniref:DUF1573 domain-containing protein n=1 Tax=Gabonibacter chumensis TaxID=2972474 RepID=UPI002572A6A6|nr:DUF1573 domain-containing protein [Gabonibacter chumensis]MCR9012858.1 DUF1573 domain-containing protein [Gabonibacter chumensis]